MLAEPDMGNLGISLRNGIEELSIQDNTIEGGFTPIEFYLTDDFERKHVLVSGNRIFTQNRPLVFWKVDDLKFMNNFINSDRESGALVAFTNCSDVYIDANTVVNGAGLSTITSSNCTNLTLTDKNILVTRDGHVDLKEYKLLRSLSGFTELSFDSTENGIIHLMVHGYTTQTIPEGVTLSPENMIEYESVNESGDLTTTLNGTTCTDSSVKRGIPCSGDISNYTDASGQKWIADYRDWANGVDHHLVEEYVLTGEEAFSDYDETHVIITWDALKNDKKSIGSDYRYQYRLLCNAFLYGLNATGLEVSNAFGTSFSVSAYESYYTNAEGLKSLCKTLYDAGTPIKILYVLQAPYTTPIPQQEMDAYNQVRVLESGNAVSNSMELYMKLLYLLPDEYLTGAKQIVRTELDAFTSVEVTEIKTPMVAAEILADSSIRTNGTFSTPRYGYTVTVFDSASLISRDVEITYAVSSDTVIPAFVVKDAGGAVIDYVMCGTSVAGWFKGTYTVPENAAMIYVNTRTNADGYDILQCIEYETKSRFRDSVSQYAYTKEQIDSALGSYITDVAKLVGGDA